MMLSSFCRRHRTPTPAIVSYDDHEVEAVMALTAIDKTDEARSFRVAHVSCQG
jgi:hypothetical protein